ncbi:hypothetical protein ABEW32_11500 [Paenibacillus jamilae]|uniref:hypothetical protein n=1 Tax=Paenibacillus jamilae TaxID=114136 RepID=UPI003D283482
MKIKVIKKIQTSTKQWIAQGEIFEARRLPEKILDFHPSFQIIEGPFAAEEIPFKLALVLPDEPQPTQQQFDELAKQNGELLDKLEIAEDDLRKAQEDIELLRTMNEDLERSKKALLQTIEREVDEQLNTEKLLQRIRELETIAQGRDEMIKSLHSELEDVSSTLKPVELPYVTVKAMDTYFKNDRRREEKAAALLNILCSSFRELTSPARHIKEHFNGDCLRLAESVVLGYTAAPEKDEAATILESVTTIVETWSHSPATDNDTKILAEQICDFIRERETAGEAVTI